MRWLNDVITQPDNLAIRDMRENLWISMPF